MNTKALAWMARLLVGASLSIVASAAAAAAPAWCANVSAATCSLVGRMGIGINIDSPLASDDGSPGTRLSPDEIADICRRFKTVRLPFRFADQDGNPLPRRISAAKALADQFVACGAIVIVDNHVFKSFEREAESGDPRAEAQFQAVWTQVAQAFRGDSPNIVLELLNEPSDRIKPQRWNAAVAAVVQKIRATGNQGPLLVGPVDYNGIWTLGQLRLPPDRGLIVGVHIYEPMSFTHQGANWMRKAMPAGVDCCDAQQYDKLQKLIGRAREWSVSAGVPILIGEFGVMRKAPDDERREYVRRFVAAAGQAQIPALYWEYDRGFGIYDPKARQWDQNMLGALAGKSLQTSASTGG